MIILDGSTGEGGGQIVRTALALSTITGKPFRVKNIRQGREKPGLKAQHVYCVKALKELCGAKAEGAEIGSSELLYIPGKLKAKNLEIDIGTAGSITLLLQAILLPSLFSTKTHTLTIKGGTDTQWSMPIDYFMNVLLPQYKRFGEIEVKLLKRGYYPKGGGHAEIKIKPIIKRNNYENFEDFVKEVSKYAFNLTEQGKLLSIKGVSHASKDLSVNEVAERQARSAKNVLQKIKMPVIISHEYSDTLSTGSGVTLWAIFSEDKLDIMQPIRLGADSLGEKRKPAEKVGQEAAQRLLANINSGAPVDSYLADNLIPILAFSTPSKIKVSAITQHTKTNIWVTELFLGKKFEIKKTIISSA